MTWKTPELSAIVSAPEPPLTISMSEWALSCLGPRLSVVGDVVEVDGDADRALAVVERVERAAAADEVVVSVRDRVLA